MFKESAQLVSEDNDEGLESPSASAQPCSKAIESAYDATTGKKLPKDVEIDGKKAISFHAVHARWPHDAITGAKLPWEAKVDGKNIISYAQKHNRWPVNAQTGEKLPWGTSVDGKKVIEYGQHRRQKTFSAVDRKRLPKGTKSDGEKILTDSQMQSQWPYDAITGKRLSWGIKVDGKKVISRTQLSNRWPYDAKTAKKLAWGTKIDRKNVVSYSTLKARWPHDTRTGEKLEWGASGDHVSPYHSLGRLRPVDKNTGKVLPYGTPLGENVIKYYDFIQEHTFVASDKKTYKGEYAKEKALSENPNLTFKTKKEIKDEKNKKERALRKAKKLASVATAIDWNDSADRHIAHAPTLDDTLNNIVASILSTNSRPQPQRATDDDLFLASTSPTLDLELDLLLQAVDKSAPQVQPQIFMPAYELVTSTNSTALDSNSAKQSKRHGNEAAPLDFLLHPSNRQF